MKVITLSLAILLFCSTVYAGQVTGTIREGNNPVSGKIVLISCGGITYEGATNSRGSFSINVKKLGRGILSLPEYSGAVYTVYSYKNPVSYKFELIKGEGQNYILRKR